MAQLLKVIQDPSIVQNVPTTSLEQLQIATEAKAAQLAQERRTQAISDALVATSPGYTESGSLRDDNWNDPTIPTSGGFVPGTWANPDRLASGSKAYGEGSLADPKMAYTMGTPGGNQAPGPLMDPGQQAIAAALTPKPVVQIRVPLGRSPLVGQSIAGGALNGRGFLSGNHGTTDWSVANQGMGGLGGLVTQSTLTPTAAPNAGFNLLSLFGGGYTPTVGYNGTTSVTAGDLAGVLGSGIDKNAVMPDSNNDKRHLTGY